MVKLILGAQSNYVRDVEEVVENVRRQKLDFAVIPLFHPRQRSGRNVSESRTGPATRSDMCMTSDRWIAHVVATVSEVKVFLFYSILLC
jgi:hypothetical protein